MVDLIGERRLPSEGRFSGKFVHGTTVNGLSSFGPLDVFTADQRMGPINKLVLASKVQTAGSVLLAVCSSGSGSYYLGEQEITDSEGSSFVAKSSRVISDINPFQREYGTKNPESVVVADGLVYWWDIERGVVVQYGSNGLFAVSSRKVSEAVAAISKSYTGGDIVGGFDYDGDELIFSVPETSAAPRSGYLQTWNAIPFPYDLHDGKEKTIFFLRKEINQWAGSGRWTAESYVAAGKEFYCFKGGALYQMNEGGYAHYFNVQHPVRVMFSVHAGLLSSFLNLSVESNKAPSFVQMRTDDPYVQETDLVEGDFKDKGGVYWSEILRDRLSPNVAAHPLINGDRMQGRYVQVMMEFDVSGGGFYLRGVGMGSDRL